MAGLQKELLLPTMCYSSRDSQSTSGYSRLQNHNSLIGDLPTISYYSYTNRCAVFLDEYYTIELTLELKTISFVTCYNLKRNNKRIVINQ